MARNRMNARDTKTLRRLIEQYGDNDILHEIATWMDNYAAQRKEAGDTVGGAATAEDVIQAVVEFREIQKQNRREGKQFCAWCGTRIPAGATFGRFCSQQCLNEELEQGEGETLQRRRR